MRLKRIVIDHYRSIEHLELLFPVGKPLVLFGPNNAGKSNILSAINRLLGERYPTYIEMLDSDFYGRDKESYPESNIMASFDAPLYYDKFNNAINCIAVRYSSNNSETILHDGSGKKIYPTNDNRSACQAYLIDAERNIQSAFNYSSQYSILSKFSHRIHRALSAEHKDELTTAFQQIKESFEKTDEFSSFFDAFNSSLQGSVKGFVHSLAVDFSAYDPNNYAKSMRIYAKEGTDVRGFEEFGTGEQQVLLMAFVKAYMQVFTSENFVLIIEEPEAHLHPLAQRWLKEYIAEMCSSGIQVVISTHSTDFIDAEYLNGLVRVYKENGITRAKQLTDNQLCEFCISAGAPSNKISSENVIDFYSTKLFSDQLKGVFAETIILVEGATEYFAIPEYLKRVGFSLPENGVEIINCRGKDSIPLFWRLFSAYGYKCYFIFDGDQQDEKNRNLFCGIIENNNWIVDASICVTEKNYAYFGKDFETYLRSELSDYSELESRMTSEYKIVSKPGKAKGIAQHCSEIPLFIIDLKNRLYAMNHIE